MPVSYFLNLVLGCVVFVIYVLGWVRSENMGGWIATEIMGGWMWIRTTVLIEIALVGIVACTTTI